MPRRVALLALLAFTLVGFAPLLGLLSAGSIATALGCRLDEGSVHPCPVGGLDIGDALYTGFVLGWLALVTWPAMLVSAGLWIWLAARWAWRRQRDGARPQG